MAVTRRRLQRYARHHPIEEGLDTFTRRLERYKGREIPEDISALYYKMFRAEKGSARRKALKRRIKPAPGAETYWS